PVLASLVFLSAAQGGGRRAVNQRESHSELQNIFLEAASRATSFRYDGRSGATRPPPKGKFTGKRRPFGGSWLPIWQPLYQAGPDSRATASTCGWRSSCCFARRPTAPRRSPHLPRPRTGATVASYQLRPEDAARTSRCREAMPRGNAHGPPRRSLP